MTDVRREWISKRAYSIWEEAGCPHGQDGDHWEQAVRERDEFERVALAPEDGARKAAKPLIEISAQARAAGSAETAAKPKKAAAKTATAKPVAAKAAGKAKSGKDAAARGDLS